MSLEVDQERTTTENCLVNPDLVAFEKAHPKVQAQFWAAIRRYAKRTHRVERAADLICPRRKPIGHLSGAPHWDEGWQRRAEAYAIAERVGWSAVRESFAQQRDRLRDIPAESYVEQLTGESVPRHRKIPCPLPDHDERTPSFHVYRFRVRCFGCDFRGDIYDLAAALWGLDVRGPQFSDVHKRLVEEFG